MRQTIGEFCIGGRVAYGNNCGNTLKLAGVGGAAHVLDHVGPCEI